MPPKPRRQDIAKLNTLLSSQHQAISNMRLFSDEDQNDSLVNRSHIMKSHHKYLQKIDKAEDIIKEARMVNAERAQIVKNGLMRKNVVRQEPNQQHRNVENTINVIEKAKIIPPIVQPSSVRIKAKSQNSTFMDRKVEQQISRIEEVRPIPDQIAENLLPKQIIQGEITKSIVSVQYLIVKNYFKDKIKGINASTSPQQIYRIMNPFYELCGVKISLPLIKKYKNCAYFGNSNKEGQTKYEGFLILHQEEKLYYGQFQNEKKNGKGTQIDFQNDAVFIGTFTKGRKNGPFTVIKPNQKYVGQILKGQYHGYGELTTNFSVYKGYFENGQRHGEGQQKFLQMGLTICGTFVNNKFTNNSEKIQHSRINTINSKSQAQQTRSKASNTPARKPINPENTPHRLFHDKNVVFQASAMSKRNFQEFDCEFGAEEDENIDELELIQARKVPHFRIKQIKQPHKAFTQRKRTISQQKTSLLNSILKS